MKTKFIILFLFISGLFSKCVEPFEHDIQDYQDILVVEGYITSEPGPYTINLSRTVPVNSDKIKKEQEALVRISDNYGNSEILTETSPGVYETSETGIQGVVGRDYTLHINTADGKKYESDPVTLNPVPEIDSLYLTYKESFSFEEGKMIDGIDINIDTKEWSAEKDYYLKWDYEETWKIYPKWPSDTFGFEPCWNIDYNDDVLIEKSSDFTSNKLTQYPVIHFTEKDYEPFVGYSALIYQYSINKSSFKFWKMVRESSLENGSIFDNVPYNPQSNIYSCDGEEEKVFGYFDAMSVDKKRIYFKSPVLGVEFTYYYDYCDCELQIMSKPAFYESGHYGEAFIVWEDPGMCPLMNVAYTYKQMCIDCSVFSTTDEKPSFWEYD